MTYPELTFAFPEEYDARAPKHAELMRAVHRSLGSSAFRNYWIDGPDGRSVDVLEDGDKACAFYVTNVLEELGLIHCAHTTIKSALPCLEQSGWQEDPDEKIGSVVVWDGGSTRHLGLVVSDLVYASNSSNYRTPVLTVVEGGEFGDPTFYSHPETSVPLYVSRLFD